MVEGIPEKQENKKNILLDLFNGSSGIELHESKKYEWKELKLFGFLIYV